MGEGGDVMKLTGRRVLEDSGYLPGGQTDRRRITVRYEWQGSTPIPTVVTVKYTIARDSYSEQCEARAELLNDLAWEIVYRLFSQEWVAGGGGYGHGKDEINTAITLLETKVKALYE